MEKYTNGIFFGIAFLTTVLFTSDGKRNITQLNPSLDGTFSSKLPPGNYLIVLETAKNSIGGSNLPASVSISSGEKTLLNIDIDTGIR